jgi:hypothetical protein
MESVTLYELLDIDPSASLEEIQSAYRRLSKTYHPDRGGTAAFFRQLQDAYGTLSDPTRRAEYDRLLKQPVTDQVQKNAVKPQPPSTGQTLQLSCPACKTAQMVNPKEDGFRCYKCAESWSAGDCPHCKNTCLVNVKIENWICPTCKKTNPSSWITKTQLACVICNTRVSFPKEVKRFNCPKCASMYTRCPHCSMYVTSKRNVRLKMVTCPRCKNKILR